MPQPPTSSEPNGLTEKKDESQIHSSASSTAPAEARLENAPVAHHAAFAEKRELDTTEKRELTEEDCYDELGYAFSTWKKWTILTVIFLVQTSMNFNTSLYSNGLVGISEKFGVSEQGARCGAMIFLVLYAFGCKSLVRTPHQRDANTV